MKGIELSPELIHGHRSARVQVLDAGFYARAESIPFQNFDGVLDIRESASGARPAERCSRRRRLFLAFTR